MSIVEQGNGSGGFAPASKEDGEELCAGIDSKKPLTTGCQPCMVVVQGQGGRTMIHTDCELDEGFKAYGNHKERVCEVMSCGYSSDASDYAVVAHARKRHGFRTAGMEIDEAAAYAVITTECGR